MMKYFAVAAVMAAQGVLSLNVHDFPKTSFSCRDKNPGEYYADLELGCQVYHICAVGQFNRLTKMSFACPNGTLFSQSSRICNSEDKVYCQLSERYYDNVQGTIDTQGDYRSVFQVTDQPVFPLEPRRPARRPAPSEDDDYEDDRSSTAAPRRPSNRRQPQRPSSTTPPPPPPPRNRVPQRQFQPQIPQQPQVDIQQPPQDSRPPAGNFLPPRTNSRVPTNPLRPQLAVVTQSPIDLPASIPQRPGLLPPPPPPAFTVAQTAAPPAPQAPNRLVVSRPNLRRPATPTTTTAAPTTTIDPNAEYEYYDYEEPADGQQNVQG